MIALLGALLIVIIAPLLNRHKERLPSVLRYTDAVAMILGILLLIGDANHLFS